MPIAILARSLAAAVSNPASPSYLSAAAKPAWPAQFAAAASSAKTARFCCSAWNLPIGRGRAFLTGINRAADVLVGGWDLSTSDIFQAGIAQAFGVSGGTYFANAIRPNVVGDPSQGVTGSIDSRLNNYFNKSAFALPANYTLGNAASRIGSVRSPGNNYINVTLSKSFQIYERVKADLRLSAFNLPNHPVFSAPNVSVGSSAFGVVNGQANAPRQMEVSLKIRF